MKPAVEAAITELRAAYPDAVRVMGDPDGGAYVIVDGLDIGAGFSPSTSWVGFHITWSCPEPDVYPHFIDPAVRYVGSGETPNQFPEGNLPTAMSRSATMPGFELPAIQVSRKSNHHDQTTDRPLAKLYRVLEIPPESVMDPAWTLTIDEPRYRQLIDHLFPGDGDEHAAVLAAGIATTDRGTRLLVREVFLAQDGVDFVPGQRGYRRLTAAFVGDRIRYCRDQELTYLAVHNHGGTTDVGFSEVDNRSHERGYPALLDISQRPVGALVLAERSLAGDIWTLDRQRRSVSESVVLGRNIHRIYPEPPPRPPKADPMYDRHVRWFGNRGQALLGRLKVGVIGAGGVGLPLTTMMARLGVGTIVSIDPDRVDQTNLPRLDANRWDALMPVRQIPLLGNAVADRFSTRKVRLARRLARRANPKVTFIGIPSNIIEPSAALQLVDCDFLFLAADGHLARMLFNAVTHQYMIPGIQIGTRIDTDRQTGDVGDIRTNLRLVLPSTGCFRCRSKSLIDLSRLQEESLGRAERERNRYVDEVPAPSVITLNTAAAGLAANDFLLMMGELMDQAATSDYLRLRPRQRRLEPIGGPAPRAACPDCGTEPSSRRARGDAVELPIPER